ncbi:hypothetical protein BpHYR1_007031 [Brachionus plicatilis]|uniref:Uncharacterized protein n=1 Tax=Brachionus plicatilis TaxID=10195 RepID=A0A3M7RZM5_BRAPC|nr:hypothetical protein BpHYR1_007031 [Brachionus plicatilis]
MFRYTYTFWYIKKLEWKHALEVVLLEFGAFFDNKNYLYYLRIIEFPKRYGLLSQKLVIFIKIYKFLKKVNNPSL